MVPCPARFYPFSIAIVYYLGNVLAVATTFLADQGTISGVYNMFLNIGGTALGGAIITLTSNSVALDRRSHDRAVALLEDYRGGYYHALGLSGLATIPSVFGMPSRERLTDAETKNEGSDVQSSVLPRTPPSETVDEEKGRGVFAARETVLGKLVFRSVWINRERLRSEAIDEFLSVLGRPLGRNYRSRHSF